MNIMSMINLKIEFEFLSGNEIIFNLIKEIADKHNIKGYLKRENDKVDIIVSAEIETVEKFLDEVGKKVPVSIFMGEAKISQISSVPEKLKDKFEIKSQLNILPLNLSTCPSCLEKLFNPSDRKFYYPFISCSYCGSHYSYLYQYPFERRNTVFKFFQPCKSCNLEIMDYPLSSCFECLAPMYLQKKEYEKYAFNNDKSYQAFKTVAGIIQKGNIVNIYTPYGYKLIGILSENNVLKIKKPITLLITNPMNLPNIAYISDAEIKLLASQEKPIVTLQAKNFKDKKLVSFANEFINIKLPDNPVLILLAKQLKEIDIPYVFIVDSEEETNVTDFHFKADLPIINKQEDLNVFVAQGRTIINSGEKGLFPNIIKSKKTGNLSIAGDYASLDLGDGSYLIDKKEKILSQLESFVDKLNNVNVLNGEYEYVPVKYKNLNSYKDYEGAILSVIGEYSKFEENSLGIYFSSYSNNDTIAVKRFNEKFKPIIKVRSSITFSNIKEDTYWILNEIKKSSEEGQRLYSNFLKKFPNINNKIKKPVEERGRKINSLTHILNILSYLTEMFPDKEPDFFDEPYKYMQAEALDFTSNRGLMVDCILKEENGIFYLDWLKLTQSILSYKIADVDNKTLAFSIFEGISEWIYKEVTTVMQKLKLNNLVIAGNFFANPVITGRLLKHFSGKCNVLINRKLPIDKQNIAFGGVFI